MNDISMWFSGLALLVSIIAILHSLSSGRSQSRLSYEQQRCDLRLDYHAAAIRIVDLLEKIMPDVKDPQTAVIAQNLSDAGEVLADCYKRLGNLRSPPFGVTTRLLQTVN